MIKQIALKKLNIIRKEASIMGDDLGGSWRDALLDGYRKQAEDRVKRIQAGISWNPSLENYSYKKRLVNNFRKKPSLWNKLRMKTLL